MKRFFVIALAAHVAAVAAGCAGYTRGKIDLTDQARRGVATVRQSLDAQRARAHGSGDALRGRLDAAFDADVAARPALDAGWVIAHRKAYAVAVDAFDADRRNADAAAQATLRTLDAIDAALAELQEMHSGELKLTLPEVTR